MRSCRFGTAILLAAILFSVLFGACAIQNAGSEPAPLETVLQTTTPVPNTPSHAEPTPTPTSVPQAEPTPVLTPTPAPTETPTPAPALELTPAPTSAPTATPAPTPTPIPEVSSSLSVHFIDVGQADAALIECDGHFMLIDGGNKADSQRIYTVLKNAGADKLDILVGTHAHEDHIGGLSGALNYASADLVLCPVKSFDSDAFESFAKYADKNGGIVVPQVGDEYTLGGAVVRVIGVNSTDDTNNSSIVIRITHGDNSFLFAGDIERDGETVILDRGEDISADVLKVAHHGSDSSSIYRFLREVMPEYSVISVGDGNSYGHPTEEVLSRLHDAGVKVFRTDMQGDIFCESDGKTVTFSVSRNADADTLVAPSPIITPSPAPAPTPTPAPTPATTSAPETEGRDYVLNTKSKKFHYPNCRAVTGENGIAEHNRKDVHTTREEVVGMEYDSCGICKP